MGRYLRRLLQAAHHDADLAGAFLAVTNLTAPPQTLVQPARVLSVIRDARRRPVATPAAPVPTLG